MSHCCADKALGHSHRVSTAEDGTEAKLDLVISKLREQDVGEYTCSATYAGNQKLEAKIMVESFSKWFSVCGCGWVWVHTHIYALVCNLQKIYL